MRHPKPLMRFDQTGAAQLYLTSEARENTFDREEACERTEAFSD